MEDGETLLETKWVTLAGDFLQEALWRVFRRGELAPKREATGVSLMREKNDL